jgi:molybdopterin-guanine dinucleotide biosynthesis adapter protein
LSDCDIALVEGFKYAPIAKVEVHRAGGDGPLLYPNDPYVIAVATDERLKTSLPQLDIDRPADVAEFIDGFDSAIDVAAINLIKAS